MAQFNVQGQWDAIQTNGVATFTMNQPRPDGWFLGSGTHGSGKKVRGTGFGTVDDDQFTFRIVWDDNTEGFYSGIFNDQGVIHGSTFDVRHPSVFAGWKSSRAFKRV